MRADGQHFEHLLTARVTDKSYGQIIRYLNFLYSQKRCSFTAEIVIFTVRYVQARWYIKPPFDGTFTQ